jgi:hypothetical protein
MPCDHGTDTNTRARTHTHMRWQSEEWQDVREDLIEDLYIRAENEARKAVIAQQSKNKRKVRYADDGGGRPERAGVAREGWWRHCRGVTEPSTSLAGWLGWGGWAD